MSEIFGMGQNFGHYVCWRVSQAISSATISLTLKYEFSVCIAFNFSWRRWWPTRAGKILPTLLGCFRMDSTTHMLAFLLKSVLRNLSAIFSTMRTFVMQTLRQTLCSIFLLILKIPMYSWREQTKLRTENKLNAIWSSNFALEKATVVST